MTETTERPKVKGSLYKPPSERPQDTKLDLYDYIEDAKVRWQIHLYEWDEFTEDVIKPTANNVWDWTLKTIDKAKVAYNNMSDTGKAREPFTPQSVEEVSHEDTTE